MKNKYILVAFFTLLLTNCKTQNHEFPLDKRYWDTNDYDEVILELKYGYEEDEKLPTFNNPEQRLIVQKLTDEQNFKIVLDDEELGLKHRNNTATKFFDHWRNMHDIYQGTDRKDRYLYEMEMLAVWQYGLGLQLDYFKLGNDQIKENSDDPNSSRTKNYINSNIGTLINNYNYYLDEVNNEKSFSENGLTKLSEGIDKYFPQLLKLYPDANYIDMKKKAELMLKKSDSNKIKSSLSRLIQLIDVSEKEKDS